MQFQIEKDEFFGSHPHSPLTREQQKGFTGLDYLPENEPLALDLTVDMTTSGEMITLLTSTGDALEYERFGCVRFEVDDAPAELTIFGDGHPGWVAFPGSEFCDRFSLCRGEGKYPLRSRIGNRPMQHLGNHGNSYYKFY